MTPRDRRTGSRGTPEITFRAGGLLPELDRRVGAGMAQSRGAVAKRCIERYLALLASGRRELAELQLSEAEACAIRDALQAMPLALDEDAPTIDPSMRLEAELLDAERLQGLAEKWSIDLDRLRTRLRTLTPLGAYALVDVCERLRARSDEATGPLLRELGLIGEGR